MDWTYLAGLIDELAFEVEILKTEKVLLSPTEKTACVGAHIHLNRKKSFRQRQGRLDRRSILDLVESWALRNRMHVLTVGKKVASLDWS